MVDAMDSKSIGSNTVRVQVPWPVPVDNYRTFRFDFSYKEYHLVGNYGFIDYDVKKF